MRPGYWDCAAFELDNRQKTSEAEARHHESDLCNGTMGLAWSNEEARQRGEFVYMEIRAGLSSNQAGDVNEGDGHDGQSGDDDNGGRDTGRYELLCDVGSELIIYFRAP